MIALRVGRWKVVPLDLIEMREYDRELVLVAARTEASQHGLRPSEHRLNGVVDEQYRVRLFVSLR